MCDDQLYSTDSNLAQLHLRVWENKSWFLIGWELSKSRESVKKKQVIDDLDDYIKFTFTTNALVQC